MLHQIPYYGALRRIASGEVIIQSYGATCKANCTIWNQSDLWHLIKHATIFLHILLCFIWQYTWSHWNASLLYLGSVWFICQDICCSLDLRIMTKSSYCPYPSVALHNYRQTNEITSAFLFHVQRHNRRNNWRTIGLEATHESRFFYSALMIMQWQYLSFHITPDICTWNVTDKYVTIHLSL